MSDAVQVALGLFDEIWTDYMYNTLHYVGDKDADELAENLVNEQYYDKLCSAFVGLLPWTSHEEAPKGSAGEREYDVIQFQGCEIPRQVKRSLSETSTEDELEYARKSAPGGGARDALCAVMAVLASRKEKVWLEALDSEYEFEQRRKENPRERRSSTFCAVLEEMHSWRVRGYFAHALVRPKSLFRMSIATDGPTPRPASLLLTYFMPITEAFALMDDGGPIRKSKATWCRRSYALQEIMKNGDGREPAEDLRAEPVLRQLIHSKTPVVFLDSLASLAPRERAREHGLSEILKTELLTLLQQSKALGQAVIFAVGGDHPHTLAQKVYLQAPFTDHGLRCGYLRWRESIMQSWAPEKPKDGRVLVGLQLP